MSTVDFRFKENQTTIEFPCNEKYLSSRFDELRGEDKLKTSQYVIGTNYINKLHHKINDNRTGTQLHGELSA